MRFFKDIFNLFYPKICISCYNVLLKSEDFLCVTCLHNLPIIEINNPRDNKIVKTFFGRIPINNVVAFLYFTKQGVTQKLIHELKYKGNQEIGTFLGNWFGYELKKKRFFNDLDCIIPVPLHPKKEKIRGYNQLTTFGQSLGENLNVSYLDTILTCTSTTKTQTLKKRLDRFNNANTKYALINKYSLEGKHILLIDDVITTGATLEACCNELLKIKNITISIATMAYTEQN